MSFNDLLGNRELISRLKQCAKSSSLPHAIIIEGADGSGKKTIASYISLLLNCQNTPEACLSCISCKKILENNHPDVIYSGLSDGRTLIGIETIRFIRSDAYVLPNESNYKIYIIENADKMTPEAQNAFLKVMEEPPSYAVFILLCKSADTLLTTVRSRATIYKTERFSAVDISKYLLEHNPEARQIYDESPDIFKLAVILSHGSIGKALENLCSEISDLNYAMYQNVLKLLEMIRKREAAFDVGCFLTDIITDRQCFDIFINMLEDALSEILKMKLADNSADEFFIDENTVVSYTSSLTSLFIIEAMSASEDAKNALSLNANLQTTITAYAWNLCSLREKY